MKRKLLLIASLVFVFCCVFALSVNAQCQGGCTDCWTLAEGNYLEEMSATNRCSVCGDTLATEKINPLFVTAGFSYNETNGGITQQFAVDRDALSRYKEITGNRVIFGALISMAEVIGNDSPIDETGAPTKDGIYVSNLTSKDIALFDVMVNDIPQNAYETAKLVCCAFVIINGEISYIDNCRKSDKVSAHSYNDIVNGLQPEEEIVKSLKVLTIGNSFSDDTMEYVYKIAKEAGVEYVELGNLRASNCTLAMHVDNANNNTSAYMFRYWADGATKWQDTGTWTSGACTMKTALEKADWDYIVFQQASSYAGDAATYDSLETLMSYVEEYAPNARFAWNMTWGPRPDYPTAADSYSSVVNAVNAKIVSNEKIDVIIPNGTAIENARTSYLTDKQLQRDSKHLNYGMGRYIAGLTLFKALTGMSIDNISYPTFDTEGNSLTSGKDSYKISFEFTDEINEICKEAANNAIENPFTVTNSEYPTK